MATTATGTARRIACLHAHHSNIGYLDEALAGLEVQVTHFVDPGLLARLAGDGVFTEADARARVIAQLEWMAHSGADTLVVTCTAYGAALPPRSGLDVPVVVVDEPLFAEICDAPAPRRLFFTNPGTVDGTMLRLREFAAARGVAFEFEVELVPNVFELLLRGQREQHDDLLADYLARSIAEHPGFSNFAMQLSMTAAARRVGSITEPLASLTRALPAALGLPTEGES